MFPVVKGVLAQDSHFSLFQSMPTAVNPASTGLVPGGATHRLMTNYRSQWLRQVADPAYRTLGAAFDLRYCPLPCDPGQVKMFGFGIRLSEDHAGSASLRRSQVQLQASYGQTLAPDLLLSVGAAFGGIFHRLGREGLYYDEQFVDGAYDAGVPGEAYDRQYTAMEDLGAGIALYTAGCGHSRGGFHVGMSFQHLTEPNYQFFDTDQEVRASLSRQIQLHGRAHLLIRRGVSATDVRFLFSAQGPYRQWLAGWDGVWYLRRKHSDLFDLVGGLAWRRTQYLESGWHSDALVTSLTLDTGICRIAMAYDVSMSRLDALQHRGAFELAFQYCWGRTGTCRLEAPTGL